ncbi:MAG: peptidase M24 [Bacteroidetes bacterium CG12_big_fil_rev_8_21_14_0_65_60_17]|nr:MAG: peptidase M24 [Bacteroidetes bacterium CG12_big_fil_rev_8_21_14_0_65_60_17]
MAMALGLSMFAASIVISLVLVLSPLRTFLPGYAGEEVFRMARQNDLRMQALADSLERQQEYVSRIRNMILGKVDSSAWTAASPSLDAVVESGEAISQPLQSEDWQMHKQPAVSIGRLASTGVLWPEGASLAMGRVLAGPAFPAQPPVDGFPTRGFDARTGHFALDIAVEEGTPVRSVGSGYVVLVDWMHDGGQVIAVQHAAGFLSVYKHNSVALKRAGDRVTSGETIARSGNSGEITTGPHVHFELWHNGLAQDPKDFLTGY